MFQNITRFYKRWIRQLQQIFAPVQCLICDQPGSYICRGHEKYLWGYPYRCYECHKPGLYPYICSHHASPLQGVLILFYYTKIIKYMISLAKYHTAYHILSFFAQKIYTLSLSIPPIQDAYLQKKLYITYVPMHYRKQHIQRGYNQAEKFAMYIAQQYNLPYYTLLKKNTYTFSQTRKSRTTRQKQSNQLYTPTNIALPSDACIVLVDDICTTGSTMYAVANVLQQTYPDAKIRGFCIARNS